MNRRHACCPRRLALLASGLGRGRWPLVLALLALSSAVGGAGACFASATSATPGISANWQAGSAGSEDCAALRAQVRRANAEVALVRERIRSEHLDLYRRYEDGQQSLRQALSDYNQHAGEGGMIPVKDENGNIVGFRPPGLHQKRFAPSQEGIMRALKKLNTLGAQIDELEAPQLRPLEQIAAALEDQFKASCGGGIPSNVPPCTSTTIIELTVVSDCRPAHILIGAVDVRRDIRLSQHKPDPAARSDWTHEYMQSCQYHVSFSADGHRSLSGSWTDRSDTTWGPDPAGNTHRDLYSTQMTGMTGSTPERAYLGVSDGVIRLLTNGGDVVRWDFFGPDFQLRTRGTSTVTFIGGRTLTTPIGKTWSRGGCGIDWRSSPRFEVNGGGLDPHLDGTWDGPQPPAEGDTIHVEWHFILRDT